METNSKLETHAIIEVMGQKKLAGYATTQVFGSTSLLRVDIPETERNISFTQYYGMGSIYCLTPVSEEIAKQTAESLQLKPPIVWESEQLIRKAVQFGVESKIKLLEGKKEDGEEYDDELGF